MTTPTDNLSAALAAWERAKAVAAHQRHYALDGTAPHWTAILDTSDAYIAALEARNRELTVAVKACEEAI